MSKTPRKSFYLSVVNVHTCASNQSQSQVINDAVLTSPSQHIEVATSGHVVASGYVRWTSTSCTRACCHLVHVSFPAESRFKACQFKPATFRLITVHFKVNFPVVFAPSAAEENVTIMNILSLHWILSTTATLINYLLTCYHLDNPGVQDHQSSRQ